MPRREIFRLLAGFRRFHKHYFQDENSRYQKLSSGGGQSPKTLVIGCSDSRVDPAILTDANPGEIFVVRNVASLVPPFESTGNFHGVSAAIEFAVVGLKVENILVLGHRQCGGIRALVEGTVPRQGGFLQKWVSIAHRAKDNVLAKFPDADVDTLCRHCEMESIIVSLENLSTFPFVEEAIKAGQLTVLGLYFDIERGELFEYDPAVKSFVQIEI